MDKRNDMTETRIPQPGEVWAAKWGQSPFKRTVVWADEQTVVYDLREPIDPIRTRHTMPTETFLRESNPPVPKLTPGEVFLNVWRPGPYVDGFSLTVHRSESGANSHGMPHDARVGMIRVWIDADGEPHVERVK